MGMDEITHWDCQVTWYIKWTKDSILETPILKGGLADKKLIDETGEEGFKDEDIHYHLKDE